MNDNTETIYRPHINVITHPKIVSRFIEPSEEVERISGGVDWVENYQVYDKISDVVPDHLKQDKEPAIIKNCIDTASEFHDPEFPHNELPLIDPTGNLNHAGWERLTWQSARDIFKDQPFYVFNGINPQDIQQQAIADCYFLGALATLATQPGLVRRLFDIEEPNDYGVYAIWLNINGTWREFVIDDYFPVVGPGQLAFVKPTHDQREIWVMLLEKAYAKAYGGYYKLNLGRAGEALRDLTGAPSYGYIMSECRSDATRREKVWDKLVSAFQNNYLVCASSQHTGTGTENKLQNGLLTDHVYSILDLQEVFDNRGKAARIIQLRNPWGKIEWNGAWSDGSSMWTQENREKFNAHDDNDDGLFWMDYFDFIENFEAVFINKVEPTFTYNSIPVTLPLKGQSFRKLVKIGIKTKGKYTFSIDSKDIHYTLEVGEIKSLKRLTICKITETGFKFVDAAYNPHRNTHCRTHFEAGEYLAVLELFYPEDTIRTFDNQPNSKYASWRNVVISSYGPSTCDLHMFTETECKNLPMDAAAYVQYRAWRSFFRSPPTKFNKFVKKAPNKGNTDVQMQTGQLKSILFEKVEALGLYFYVLRTSGRSNIQCYAEISTCEGYDIICREGSIGRGSKKNGLLKIPDGSCEILVLRPIDNKCRQGSLFGQGVHYDEVNLLTSAEDEVHNFLLRKQMFVDLANVEKTPNVQKATPKVKKVLYKGEPNNKPKADPYDVTMGKRYSNTPSSLHSKDAVLDHGTSEVKKRYANAQNRGNMVTPNKHAPVFNGRIYDPATTLSGSSQRIQQIHKARASRSTYVARFGDIQARNDKYLKENLNNEKMYDDYENALKFTHKLSPNRQVFNRWDQQNQPLYKKQTEGNTVKYCNTDTIMSYAHTKQNSFGQGPSQSKNRRRNNGNILQYMDGNTPSRKMGQSKSWREKGQDTSAWKQKAQKSPLRNRPAAGHLTPTRTNTRLQNNCIPGEKSPSFYQKLKKSKHFEQENRQPTLVTGSPVGINQVGSKSGGNPMSYPQKYPVYAHGIVPGQKSPYHQIKQQHATPNRQQAHPQHAPVSQYPQTAPRQAPAAQQFTNDQFFNNGRQTTGAKARNRRQGEEVMAHPQDVQRKLFNARGGPSDPREAEKAYMMRRAKGKHERFRKPIYQMSPTKDQEPTNFYQQNQHKSPQREQNHQGRRSPNRGGQHGRYNDRPEQPRLDKYGRPINAPIHEQEPPKAEYWAGRAPMKPPSPPKFARAPEELEEENLSPERRRPNYVEISPGVRSSPWRDDIQKQKELKRQEILRQEKAERLREEQNLIFFKKRRRQSFDDDEEAYHNPKSQKPLILKGQDGRYPNPEDMYNQFRQMQERNLCKPKRGARNAGNNSIWGRESRNKRGTANKDRSPNRSGYDNYDQDAYY